MSGRGIEPLPPGALWMILIGTLLSSCAGFICDLLLHDVIALLIFYVLYVSNIFVAPAIHAAILRSRRAFGKSPDNL